MLEAEWLEYSSKFQFEGKKQLILSSFLNLQPIFDQFQYRGENLAQNFAGDSDSEMCRCFEICNLFVFVSIFEGDSLSYFATVLKILPFYHCYAMRIAQ